MSGKRKSAGGFTRHAAMAGRPKRLPFLRQEEIGGKLRVTVRLQRAGWLRWLAGSGEVERTFALDALGREVYDAADGSRTAQVIVREFATRHKVSVAEAELAVTTFLRTLMRKGLVAMLVERE